MARDVILVTGSPGVNLSPVVFCLRDDFGYQPTWPGQDLDVSGGREAEKRGENIEVIRIHSILLGRANCSWLSFEPPEAWDPIYPGPREFLAQFPEQTDVVVADFRLCTFLPLWLSLASRIIVVTSSVQEAAQNLAARSNELSLDRSIELVVSYRYRLDRQLMGIPCYRLRLEGLSRDNLRSELQGKLQESAFNW